jgi:eukaryotic-like serine/threonine-protein kinase
MGPTTEPTAELVAGKYRLTRLLGRGGMGSVWEGVHETLGTHVAVKFIENDYVDSSEARSRFENEAKAAAKLTSKHAVKVYDHGVMSDGRPYIVMEYLSGEPLDARLARYPRLALADTARIVIHIARALSQAHQAGIIHRDLKPENIFLVRDEDEGTEIAKVVDFGIAKFTESSAGLSSSTKTGSVLGTPYFMSPEQARGLRSIDYRTDLWSMGVIAYRCLVGELPFIGEAVGDLLVQICVSPLPVASQKVPGLPPAFDAWLRKALARDPAERFQSAPELAEALGSIAGITTARSPMHSQWQTEQPLASAPTMAATDSGSLPRLPAEGVTAAPFTQNTPLVKRGPPLGLIAGGAVAVLALLVGVLVVTLRHTAGSASAATGEVEAIPALSTAPAAPPAVTTAPPPSASVAEAPEVAPTVDAPASASAEAPTPVRTATPRTHAATSKTSKTGKTAPNTKTPTGTGKTGTPDVGY